MKKNIFILIIFLILSTKNVNAIKLEENKIISQGKTNLFTVLKTNDGNYLVSGWQFAKQENSIVMPYRYIAKSKPDGTIIWEKLETNYLISQFNKIIEIEDGNFLAVGSCFVYGCAAKYDKDGNLIWEEITSIQSGDAFALSGAYTDIEKIGSNYLIIGYTHDSFNNSNHQMLKVYDTNGNEIYSNVSTSGAIEKMVGVEKTTGNEYFIVGSCNYEATGTKGTYQDGCLAKFDSNHNLIWKKIYNKNKKENFLDFKYDKDNNLVITGFKTNEDNTSSPIVLTYNQNGELVSETILNLNYSNINGFILKTSPTGDNIGVINTGEKSIALLLDNEYNVIYKKEFGSDGNNILGDFIFEADGIVIPYSYMKSGTLSSSLTLEDCKEQYKTTLSKYNIEFEIFTNTPENGTYKVTKEGNKGKINLKPNSGYKLEKLYITDANGNKLTYTKENDDNYYFALGKYDIKVYVFFEKNDESLNITKPFNNAWKIPLTESFAAEDDSLLSSSFEKNMETAIYKYKNGYIASTANINNDIEGIINLYNHEGKMITTTNLPNEIVLDIESTEEKIYILSIYENNYNSQYEMKLTKYNNELKEEKIIEVIKNIDISTIISFKSSSIKLLNIFGNKIYALGDNALYEYDLNLNKTNEYSEENERDKVCEVLPILCSLIENNENKISIGYDNVNDKKVYSGCIELADGQMVSYIEYYDKDQIKFSKTFDEYYLIGAPTIINNYIVAIGLKEINSVEKSEIIILDFNGNIIQTIKSKSTYFNIIPNQSSFITTAYKESVCENNSVIEKCVVGNIEKYYLPLNQSITVIGEGTIELPDKVKAGDRVEYQVKPKFGYEFKGLKLVDSYGNVTTVTSDSFIMPEGDISIEAIFEVSNPNTKPLLKLGLIIIIIFTLYNLSIFKKIRVKKYI